MEDLYALFGDADFQNFDLQVSVGETENHVLNMYGWRYLAQKYLEWVAGLDESDPRFDRCLKALYESDTNRYQNDTDLTDFLLKISARFLHHGAFETNALPYEGITLSALINIAQYSQMLVDDDERKRVGRAAQSAVDFLATQYALQSSASTTR